MTERKKHDATTTTAKAIEAILDRATRLLEALSPRPQVVPIPVRVRARRG